MLKRFLMSARITSRNNAFLLPALMTLLIGLLAIPMTQADRALLDSLPEAARTIPSDWVSNATALLSVVAGASAAIGGTVLSLMLVVLTLASQQYGPLIVANFNRDRLNQAVFGIFMGTFVYCVVALLAIASDRNELPTASVTMAVGLAILCALAVIFFIHHIATGIRPTAIIQRATQQLGHAIDGLVASEAYGRVNRPLTGAEQAAVAETRASGLEVFSLRNGYVNLVDVKGLVAHAREHDVQIALLVRAGSFVVKGTPVARVSPPERWPASMNAVLADDDLLIITHRTPVLDIELAFTQLVAISVRALSPAVNDPFTAMMGIDHLGQGLVRIALDYQPALYHADETGQIRLALNQADFASLLHLAFDQIRYYGLGDLRVMLHMLNTIRVVGEVLHAPEEQRILQRYAGVVWGEARQQHPADAAQTALREAYELACARLLD